MAGIKVEKFTSGTAATWTKDANAEYIRLVLVGGGGSGGAGRSRGAGLFAGGGAGGGGGGIIDLTLGASELGATETYTVAAAVTGGTGVAAGGNAGSNGNST